MDYPQRMQRAIDHIEAHLTDTLPMEDIARQAFLSVPHLYRIFPIMTGCSVGQYVRKRRLSSSAGDLVRSHRRVVDIALDYCFESQESYIRAFKAMFGVTPGEYRKTAPLIAIYNKLQLNQLQKKEALPMQPEIIKRKLMLVGLQTNIDLRVDFTEKMNELRNALRRGIAAIGHKVEPSRMVGFWFPDLEQALSETYSKCLYFTGVEVTAVDDMPQDFILKDLPQSLFAQFREQSRGTMSRYAYTQWLPTSGYILNMDLPGDFEIFDDMEHDGVDDTCDILLPIRTPEENGA